MYRSAVSYSFMQRTRKEKVLILYESVQNGQYTLRKYGEGKEAEKTEEVGRF